MIVITCSCDVMSRELIAQAIGHDEFELVNKYPGGALHLQRSERGTLEYTDTRREVAKRITGFNERGHKRIQVCFAMHASCDYTLDVREYPWRPTGELGQLRGLSELLEDCEKAIESYFIHPRARVRPSKMILYVNEVETGIFWIDFTDLENRFQIEWSDE